MRLKDKVCVVTAAGQGIGAATARAFAREGRSHGLGRFYQPLVGAVSPTVAPLAGGPTYREACGRRPLAFQPARREHAGVGDGLVVRAAVGDGLMARGDGLTANALEQSKTRAQKINRSKKQGRRSAIIIRLR